MKYVVGFIVGVAVGILISELMFAVKNNGGGNVKR